MVLQNSEHQERRQSLTVRRNFVQRYAPVILRNRPHPVGAVRVQVGFAEKTTRRPQVRRHRLG